MNKKAIFLDKDGTLVEDVPYNVDPRLIRIVPGVIAGLNALRAAGYSLVVVSNQSGVARGFFEEGALHEVENKLRELFGNEGVTLDGFYWCPHHPDGVVKAYTRECPCRKPKPGMLLRAAMEKGIRLADSWMIGDRPSDVEAGVRAGCRSILLAANPCGAWTHVCARTLHEASEVVRLSDEQGWRKGRHSA